MSWFGGFGSSLEGLPWPAGDAGRIRAAAGTTRRAAQALGEAASALAAHAAGPSGWRGPAASAFRDTIVAERAAMERSATALAEAARELRRLAEALTEGQAEVRRLAAEVRVAEQAAAAAAARAALAITADLGASVLTGGDPAFREMRRDADEAADRARAAASGARGHAAEVRARATRRAEHICERLHSIDMATANAVDRAAAAAPMGGRGHALAASPARTFGARVFGDLTRSDWEQLAYFMAGIREWDPSEGLLANDANVRAVYAFYGRLWSGDHDLQWAGMANLVGPLFYAGWQDLYVARTQMDGGDRLEYYTRMLNLPRLPGFAYTAADIVQDLTPAGVIADLSGEELEWFERRFLHMQKQIFDDMAWRHAAYSLGGVELMRELHRDGELDLRELQPFEDIASGLPQRVREGNAALLRREQHDIIQNDYDAMRDHHGPVGEAFTRLLTWTAENPIEGGDSYRHDFHHNPRVPIPIPGPLGFFVHPTVPIPLDVPTGNVADFEDRWRWIEEDMLPAYLRGLEDPEHMQEIVDRPVEERADDRRMVPLPYPGG